VGYGELLGGETKRIRSININAPQVTLEQQGGKFNFQALDAMSDSSEETMKLIIENLQVTDATVRIRPGIPGLDEEYAVTVPSLQMTNVGTAEGAENGAAIGVVLKQVATALAGEAMKNGDLPAELEAAL